MTNTFLKSTTAIVLSLSLAVPTATMAQTAAELEAALDVDTSNMTETELDQLRKQYAEQQAIAATTEAEANERAGTEEEQGLFDRAVGAVKDGIDNLTGDDEAEQVAEAPAEAEATTDAEATTTAEAEASSDGNTNAFGQPVEETDQAASEQMPAADADAQADAETTAEAPAAEVTTDAESEATATAETEATEETSDTAAATDSETSTDAQQAEATAETETDEKTAAETADFNNAFNSDNNAEATETDQQAQVNDLEQRLGEASNESAFDAAPEESAEAQAERQAAAEAEAAQAQSGTMAANADADAEATEVVEETVTEENSRSSSEEFATDAAAANAESETTAQNNSNGNDGSGLNELGRIALFGLGALAVGQMLKNGSEVVSNSGDRVVVQQPDGSYRVLKNDDVLMFQPGTDVRTYAYDDGSTRTVATREDGTQIETVRAADGTVLRRTRILADGSEVVLFDDTRATEQVVVNQLPQVNESRNAINFQQAEEEELRAALAANLPENVDRRFSLSQVRNINAVRGLVQEIGVDNINFDTGSATIRPEEAEELAQLGSLMRQRIEDNPGEVFLIEGHTDAVGSASYNLALSDRRAESLALALTEYFQVPPENMVVQGYGESDLKIRTADAERENRRAAVRRITPLLSGS